MELDDRPHTVDWEWSSRESRNIAFSSPRIEDCSSFLAEIWCESAEYDDHNRSIKYLHAETQPDDTLHAINYVTALARLALDQRSIYGHNGPGLRRSIECSSQRLHIDRWALCCCRVLC